MNRNDLQMGYWVTTAVGEESGNLWNSGSGIIKNYSAVAVQMNYKLFSQKNLSALIIIKNSKQPQHFISKVTINQLSRI